MSARAPLPIRAGEIVRLAIAVIFFTAAPTAGDIGSCSQPEDDLDPAKFFSAKQRIDCEKCLDCAIPTEACANACDTVSTPPFEKGCVPLVHDGEVCLDALEAAACEDYKGFMADQGATVPTECNFCPERSDAGTTGSGGGSGGSDAGDEGT